MNLNKPLKILLIFFTVAILMVLSAFAYMIFYSSNKQTSTLELPLNTNTAVTPEKAVKKSVGETEKTAEFENNNQAIQNITAVEEKEKIKEEMKESFNAGNPPSTNSSASAPSANKTPTAVSVEEYLKAEKVKEDLKKKMIESLNK